MLKIYKYNTDSQWKSFIEALNNSNKIGLEREAAIQEYIEANGQLVTVQEYFADRRRNESEYWSFAMKKMISKGYSYQCYGEVTNCFEKLAYGEMEYDNDLYYCDLSKSSPEDLCESRTDWDDLKEYADGLVSFIDKLKDEIAEGKITIP